MSLQVDEEQHPEQLNLKQHQATGRGNSKRNSKQVDEEEQHPEQLNPKQHQATGRGNSKHNSIKTAVNTVLASNELSRRQKFAKTRSMSTKGREREHIKSLSLKAGTKHIELSSVISQFQKRSPSYGRIPKRDSTAPPPDLSSPYSTTKPTSSQSQSPPSLLKKRNSTMFSSNARRPSGMKGTKGTKGMKGIRVLSKSVSSSRPSIAEEDDDETNGNEMDLDQKLDELELKSSNARSSTIEIAAFTHMVEWCEGAERVKTELAMQDAKAIQELGDCPQKVIDGCCPAFICCSKSKLMPHSNPSLFSKNCGSGFDFNHSTYVTSVESKYMCCCCLYRTRLTLCSSLFIWWNLPLPLIKARFVLLFQTSAQLLTTIFQWIFFYSVYQSNNEIAERTTVLYVVLATFILPELVHVLYITFAPGYNIRSIRRNYKQILFTLLSQFGVRPLYDLMWSYKYTQLMPYVTMQHEGNVVSDTGIHERAIIWTGLATTLRELPLKIAQMYILFSVWAFWGQGIGQANSLGGFSGKVRDDISVGGALAACTDLNEYSVIAGAIVGFFVSAFALSDQLEREIPHGAFPRRFSRALSREPCGSTALLWSAIFMCGFFVDLSLRFAIILPLATVAGAGKGMLVIVLFLLQSSFLCWILMTETKENMLDQHSGKTKSMKMKRRFSDGSMVKSPNTSDTKDKRSDSDSYDHGMLLHEISEQVGQSRCSSVIETLPFILWGIWVDLPMRLKWLRLREGNNDSKNFLMSIPKSLAYYIISSGISIIIIISVGVYNSYSLEHLWQHGTVECIKIIPPGCVLQYDNVTCPMNLSTVSVFEAVPLDQYPSSMLNTTWILGCTNDVGVRCLPEIQDLEVTNSNSINIEVLRYMYDSHQTNTWPFFWFIILIDLKFIIVLIVTYQFYLVDKEDRGKCCCTSAAATFEDADAWDDSAGTKGEEKKEETKEEKQDNTGGNKGGNNGASKNANAGKERKTTQPGQLDKEVKKEKRRSKMYRNLMATGEERKEKRGSKVKRGSKAPRKRLSRGGTLHLWNSDVRKEISMEIEEHVPMWKTNLRARDIQLMFRMSRLMPTTAQLDVTKEDVDMYQIAKLVLGTGGAVDDEFSEELDGVLQECHDETNSVNPMVDLM